MSVNSKDKKLDKQKQQKEILSNRISELGLDGVLYPVTHSERHPYTQEIILLAMSHDIKQEELSQLCGVSQSQISQWANGSGFATMEQLATLLPRLKNTAPGKSFHYFEVVTKTYIELPENWEQESFLPAFKKPAEVLKNKAKLREICKPIIDELHEKSNRCDWHPEYCSLYWNNMEYDLESLKLSVYGRLEQEQSAQCREMEDVHEQQLNMLRNQLASLKKHKQRAEDEEQDNWLRLGEHNSLIQRFFDERPELESIDDEIKTTLALREHPKPALNQDVAHEYALLLVPLAAEYGVDIVYSDIQMAIEQKIAQLTERYESELAELKQGHKQELEEKTIFGKYNESAFTSLVEINSSLELMDTVIKNKSNELYSSQSFELAVPMSGYIKDNMYGLEPHRFRHHERIDLDPAGAFIEYCKKLTVKYEHERVQVSGQIIYSSCDDLICYRLNSDRLLIKHRNHDGQDYIYIEDNADAAINTARQLKELYNIAPGLEDELKQALVLQGYLLSDIRSIY